MSALPKLTLSRMTVAEFIDWPGDGTGLKHQLIDGEPQARSPASITHGRMQATLAQLLGNHLIGTNCYVVIEPGVVPRVRSEANMRVPDLAVTCAPGRSGEPCADRAGHPYRGTVAEQRARNPGECVGLHDDPNRSRNPAGALDACCGRADPSRA